MEAALLMPIILSAVIALIYAVFLFHDKNRIEASANASMIRSERELRHNLSSENGRIDYDKINEGDVYAFLLGNYDKKEKSCVEYLDNKLKKGLFLLTADRITFTMKRDQLKYQIEMQCKIKMPLLQSYLNSKITVIKKEIKYQDSPDFVRKTVALLGGNFRDGN